MAELNKPQNIIILVLGVAVLALLYAQFVGFGNLSSTKAAEASLNYINNDILQGSAVATLVGDVVEENGVYKFQLDLGGQQFYSYVTKNGKMLFPEGIEMVVASTTPTGGDAQATGPTTCEEVVKTNVPQLEAFVVSYCPYGLQMQRVLTEISKRVPEIIPSIKIKYMGSIVDGKITAMHGDEEAQENLKQICIREEQPTKFFPYLDCFMKAGDSVGCSATSGIDGAKLASCQTDPSKGIAYAQADFVDSDGYGVTGSPTLILDGQKVSEFNFGGRTADAVKTLLCCAYQAEPATCSAVLSQEAAAASFSEDYVGTSATTDASCE